MNIKFYVYVDQDSPLLKNGTHSIQRKIPPQTQGFISRILTWLLGFLSALIYYINYLFQRCTYD